MRSVSSILLLVATACSAAPEDQERDLLYAFLVGTYAVVGKNPDGGATYSGTAEIKDGGGKLILTKHLKSGTVVVEGLVDRASPGEGKVVRFVWPGHKATCLPHSDLDNYGRLSCYWTVDGKTHKEPGLEAYFSTVGWPK